MIDDGRQQTLEEGEQTVLGIGGFNLYAHVSDTTTLTASVPDKVLEDGTVASDDIIREPLRYTISGVVSDIFVDAPPVDVTEEPEDDLIGEIADFYADKTQAELMRMAKIDGIYRIVKHEQAKDAFRATEGLQTKPIRQQFLDFIQSVYNGRQLISVEGINGVIDNMAITSLSLNRDNKSQVIRFEIDLKQVRMAVTKVVGIEEFYKAPSKPAKKQTAKRTDQGVQDVQGASEDNKKQARSLLGSLMGG